MAAGCCHFSDGGLLYSYIAFAVSLMGWFGLNINLFMDTVGRLVQDLWGWNIPRLVLAIIASTCMTLTTLVGFRAINLLSTLLVPVLAVVTVLFGISAFSDNNWSDFLAMDAPVRAVGDNAMSIGDGISWVVGAVIIGAIILPDITRFIRRPRGGVYTSIVTYLIVGILVMGAAGLAGAGAGIFDSYFDAEGVSRTDVIIKLMLDVNLGLGAFIVIIIDRLFLRPEEYNLEALQDNKGINLTAVAAWAVGAVFAILADHGVMPTLTEVGAMDALVLSAVLYFLLSKLLPQKRAA